MNFDPLFELDTVRDFMIDHGCKVTNHQLVTHFKRFLNDPNRKAANREKFKDYVNTLAIVKLDESGEKVLVLKRKYRDVGGGEGSQEVSGPTPRPKENKSKPKPHTEPPSVPAAVPMQSTASPAMSENDQLMAEDCQENKENTPDCSSPSPESEKKIRLGLPVGESTTDDIVDPQIEVTNPDTAPSLSLGPPIGESTTDSHTGGNPEIPTDGTSTASTSTVVGEDEVAGPGIKRVLSPVSVKERARHLNKMQSETDLNASKIAKQDKDKKDEDSQSVSSVGTVSLEPAEREWMITCASADYHPMAKLLNNNQALARKKDFITGFTALHWAAKHGKPDVIKLLCGTPGILMNARSNGGYTALHLAAMQGHEDIIELLVQGYGADPNIRDHSGKKPKQYLRNSASTRAQQLLAARRLSTAVGMNAPFKRVGSYSAKIRSTGFFGISGGSAVRNSWTGGSDRSSDKSPSQSPRQSPSPSPRQSPAPSPSNSRKASLTDVNMMPPPKLAPPRRKKKKDPNQQRPSSDSEMGSHMEPEFNQGIPQSKSSIFI